MTLFISCFTKGYNFNLKISIASYNLVLEFYILKFNRLDNLLYIRKLLSFKSNFISDLIYANTEHSYTIIQYDDDVLTRAFFKEKSGF